MAMTRHVPAVALLLLVTSIAPPVARAQKQGETYAQRLVNDFVRRHSSEVTAVELAILSDSGCATLAATDPKDVGEKCDDDEKGPIRTGQPDVEAPSKADPVYDITQALHDSGGRLIGAVGMDIKPEAGPDKAAVVARAKELLAELEAQIPSKEKLFERTTSGVRTP
jgi:hypothetical protein